MYDVLYDDEVIKDIKRLDIAIVKKIISRIDYVLGTRSF